MRYLKIKNAGVLDLRLISLMGATTKREDQNKIGEFGTGLKYSIAYLLTHNIDFKIFLGTKEIEIHTKSENISGTIFDIIYVDDERTSITTSMSHKWQAWYIIREIWCNAIDEGGEEVSIVEGGKFGSQYIVGEEDTTTFYIQMLPEITEVYSNWSSYFSATRLPVYEGEKFKLYSGDSKEMVIYRNGIRVYTKPGRSVFHYDFHYIDINEMREVKSEWDMNYKIAHVLAQMKSIKQIEVFLNNTIGSYEEKVDFDLYGLDFEEEWTKTIGDAKIISPDLRKLFSKQIDASGVSVVEVPETLYKKLSRTNPTIGALTISDNDCAYVEHRDDELDKRITEAVRLLQNAKYDFLPEVKIITAMFTRELTIGMVSRDLKTIILSYRLKDMGMFELVATIVEEMEHLRTGYDDCSRSFQDHFIKLYLSRMLDRLPELV